MRYEMFIETVPLKERYGLRLDLIEFASDDDDVFGHEIIIAGRSRHSWPGIFRLIDQYQPSAIKINGACNLSIKG